eukprot:166182_1
MVFNVEDFKLCSIGESGSKNRKRVKLIRCRSSKIHHSKTSAIYSRFYWFLRYFYLFFHLLCYGNFNFNEMNQDYGIIGELGLWMQSNFYNLFKFIQQMIGFVFKNVRFIMIYLYIDVLLFDYKYCCDYGYLLFGASLFKGIYETFVFIYNFIWDIIKERRIVIRIFD